MSNPFENGQLRQNEEKGPVASEGKKQEFRETREKLEKNDIIINELGADSARTLLHKAGIKFDYKLLAEAAKASGTETALPREFIFRLENKTDESADRAFALLKEAKIHCDIIKEVIDLDEVRKTASPEV